MDSDEDVNSEDSSEYYSHLVCLDSFPDGCSNEAQGIEALAACFMDRYSACPAFFVGSLQDACRRAFDSPVIGEHRPILIYIHHEKALSSHIFCLNVLCSELTIDYLLENYIVWPWDITHPSNREVLIEMWKDVFPDEPAPYFSMKQCPMLIGIINSSKYHFSTLLKSDIAIHTAEGSSTQQQVVLKKLLMFREKFEVLSCAWVPHSRLSKETTVEICKYLSLNDAIKAFSSRVLFYLGESAAKVHITEPCEAAFEAITQRIKSEQILSLCLDTDESCLKMVVDFLPKFNRITSLTLLNLQALEAVSQYGVYFPQLTRLSLRYNNEIGLNVMRNIFFYLPWTILRFEIHCTRVLCTHYEAVELFRKFECNFRVQYFLLDLDCYPLISSEECFQQHQTCFLMTTRDLLRCMQRLLCVHLIINQYDLENLLHIEEWKDLSVRCSWLKKVKLQTSGNVFQDEGLARKILDIQNECRYVGRGINFQVIHS